MEGGDEELERLIAQNPGARIVRPGDPMPAQPPTSADPEADRQQRRGLEEMRSGMDAAARFAKAEECKAQANEHFGNGKWKVSMVGYVAGIFFLKRGAPPCPMLVASEAAGLGEVASALGAGGALEGSTGGSGDGSTESEGVVALRTTCHLNLAQAALKLEEWSIAQTACTYVLECVDEHNVKALFRLAKAQQGASDFRAALATIARLLKREPTNVEARRLGESLKKQRDKEKKAFAGLFDRAQAEGEGGLYGADEEARDKAEQAARAANPPPHSHEEAELRQKGMRTIRGSDIQGMTPEQQQAFCDEINAGLDAEAGDPGAMPSEDFAAAAAAREPPAAA